MNKSEKKLKDLSEKLSSLNSQVITDKITSLRDENPFNGAIGLLVKFYNTSNNLYIKEMISNFLNDIKEPNARKEIIDELRTEYSGETITMLVCSCWQSGLDYSGFSNDFAEIFVSGDFLTSLECFTVIEESLLNITDQDKSQIIKLLEKNIGEFSDEKASLTKTLISILH
jgi:hypothetical protein